MTRPLILVNSVEETDGFLLKYTMLEHLSKVINKFSIEYTQFYGGGFNPYIK